MRTSKRTEERVPDGFGKAPVRVDPEKHRKQDLVEEQRTWKKSRKKTGKSSE